MVELSTHEREQELLINFSTLMKRKLFTTTVQAANSKEELEYYVPHIDTDMALHRNFIKFGNKRAISFLIIDIDNIHCSLQEYKNRVLYALGENCTPNWILRSSKGFHVGFVLERPVFYNNQHDLEILRNTKKNLTTLLKGDYAGSLRTRGYWRNPLMHNSILNLQEHNLYELHKLTEKLYKHSFSLFENINQQAKKKEVHDTSVVKIKWNEIDSRGFIEGNRNNYLFNKIVKLLYNGIITNEQVLETLKEFNKGALSLEELIRIERSVLKYKIKPQPNSRFKKEYIPGPYHKELQNHQIHNRKFKNKIEYTRQKFGQKITTAKIIKNTLTQLIQAYKYVYVNNQSFTNKNIESNCQINKRTIQRYRNERDLEQKIKNSAFRIYIKELLGLNENVIADVTPLLDLVNYAVKDLKFELKSDERVFVFNLNDIGNFVFYEKLRGSTQF